MMAKIIKLFMLCIMHLVKQTICFAKEPCYAYLYKDDTKIPLKACCTPDQISSSLHALIAAIDQQLEILYEKGIIFYNHNGHLKINQKKT